MSNPLKEFYERYKSYITVDMYLYLFMVAFIIVLFIFFG